MAKYMAPVRRQGFELCHVFHGRCLTHIDQFYDEPRELVRRLCETLQQVDPGDTISWKTKVVLGFWTVSQTAPFISRH